MTSMLRDVVEVEPVGDYRLRLKFDNGVEGELDFAKLLSFRGVFAPCKDPEFFRSAGFQLEIEPVEPDFLIEATPARKFLGLELEILEVPGHCPGSLCFYSRSEKLLIGGDVLFAGGVGRWDLPGGDGDLLFRGIKEKLYPLGDDVIVLPGHGPATTIGAERRTNPFVH